MPKIVYRTIEEVTTPRDGEAVTSRWWSYVPDKGVIFAKFGHNLIPQCNSRKDIAKQLTKELYPDAEVIFLEVAFIGYVRGD